MHDATAIVDLESYPIHELSGDAGRKLATECRQQYLDNGLCILPDFIRPDALQRLAGEAESVRQNAYFCNSTHNAYLNDANADEGNESRASQQQETTYVGSVAYDYLAGETELDQLYSWDALKDFIGYVIGKKPLYRLADPFGACSINVFVDGGEHGWHFDESEFTVTLMLQKPAHGGAFE